MHTLGIAVQAREHLRIAIPVGVCLNTSYWAMELLLLHAWLLRLLS